MSFTWPLALPALLLVPLALAGYLLAQRRRARYAVPFTNLDVLAGVVPARGTWRRWLPVACYLGALSALLLGLARPQASVAVPKEQATVILVMDVSRSMNATDVAPSRIEAARRNASTFVDQLPSTFPVGVVAFDETANVLARPTTDRGQIQDVIDGIRTGGSTAMGDGIRRALDLRAGGPDAPPPPAGKREPETVILLLSDGSNQTGESPVSAAAAAAELRVPVYTIALGTPDGVLYDFGGAQRVPPDPETLAAVASRTGGRFYAAPSDADLRSIYKELSSRIGFVYQRQEVTVVFAAVGLLLLVGGAASSALFSGRLP